MNAEERQLEERKLRRQSWQVAASFLSPVVAVGIAFITLGAELRTQAESAHNQLLAQTGTAGECKRASCLRGMGRRASGVLC